MNSVSVIIPTKNRQNWVNRCLNFISVNSTLPLEVLIIDASEEDYQYQIPLNISVQVYKKTGGPALQRNYGAEKAVGEYLLFIDDDIFIDNDFIQSLSLVIEENIKACTAVIKNQCFDLMTTTRWKAYNFLKLVKVIEPGKYDKDTGIPVNRYGRLDHNDNIKIDFCGAGCLLVEKELFWSLGGFNCAFFREFSIVEDVHLTLRISQKTNLVEVGSAKCNHDHAPGLHRSDNFKRGKATVLNYWFIFNDVFGPLKTYQKRRFIKFQLFEWVRSFVDVFRFRSISTVKYFFGKTSGITELLVSLI